MPDIERIKKEYDSLLEQLSDPELISDWERFEELNRKKGSLEKIIEKNKELNELIEKIEENRAIISAGEDKELVFLAEEEMIQLQKKKKELEEDLKNINTADDDKKFQPQSVIVEIRAGAGGKEAALFVGDLFRMYSKFAQTNNWQQSVLDSHPTELGGFKQIIFDLKPGRMAKENVFSKMQYEGGVHRVQRIPKTEKSGRVHTSTASVAVLPKPKKTQIKINPADLKIDTFRASGPGGQYVNRRETAIRITHLPSGLVVTSQTERNQLQNKESAMAILEAKLLERKEEQEESKMAGKRKSQIGRAKRAEKIRTYNFPQDRVTDHRIKKSFYDIEGIMDGKLGSIIYALEKAEK